jgi:hypothetical protein
MTTAPKHSTLRKLVLVAGLAAVIGGLGAAPAFADEWHHDRDGWRGEHFRHDDWRHDDWRWRERYEHRPYVAVSPGYYGPGYAYAPPPVAYGAPALNFVFPLHIR